MNGKHEWVELKLRDDNGNIFKAWGCPKCRLVVVAVYGYRDFPAGSVTKVNAKLVVVGVKTKNDPFDQEGADRAAERAGTPCP